MGITSQKPGHILFYPAIFRSLLFFTGFFPAQPVLAEAPPPEGSAGSIPEIEVRELPTRDDRSRNFVGLKANVPTREVPLTVEKIQPEFLNHSRLHTLDSILDGNSLVNTSPDTGGMVNEIILRGFTDISFQRNGLNDSYGSLPVRDLANIQSVEILKGANSALYGPGEPGGIVNFITKQPEYERSHSIQFSIGNYSRYRIEADTTGPVPGNGHMAYRMIAAYEDSNSFRDFVTSRKIFGASSFNWTPNDRVNLLAEVEYVNHRVPFDSGTIAVDGSYPLPDSMFLGEPALDPVHLESFTSTLSLDLEPVPGWDLSATLQWQKTMKDMYSVEPEELDDPGNGERFLIRLFSNESDEDNVLSSQLELGTLLNLGSFEQQLLVGYEFTTVDNGVVLSASDTEVNDFELDIFNIRYGQTLPELSLLKVLNESTNQHSVYVQDFLKYGSRLRILLGARLDVIDTETEEQINNLGINQRDTEVSTRAGIVYSLNDVISLFSSYNESIDPNEGLTPDGIPLVPTLADSIEAGVKFHAPSARLDINSSVYRIEQKNVAMDAPDNPGFEIQTARQISKGIDLDISYWPLESFQTSLKYGYTDTFIRDDPEIPDGTKPYNVPAHKIIVSGLYYHSIRQENDLLIGMNVMYKGKQQASLDEEELDTSLPAYWLADLFIDYRLNQKISLGLNISNILDKKYLAGTQGDLLHIVPGQPFTILGKLKIHY